MIGLKGFLLDNLRYIYHSPSIQGLREKRIRLLDPWIDKELKKNIQFKNKYKGNRCFILGNGPSLEHVDFSLLANEYTFTVNQIARNKKFHELKTNFHMWSDERFFEIDKQRPEDLELIETMKRVSTESNKPYVFYKTAAHKIVSQFKLDKCLRIQYFEQGWYRIKPNSYIDYTKFTPAFSTVVHYLICLAVYMGFSEIYLLGCDCTSVINVANSFLHESEQSLYAYEISNNEKLRMERMQSKTTVKEELTSSLRVFEDYELLYKYCLKNGVKLYNATNPTLLDSVPKIELEKVLHS